MVIKQTLAKSKMSLLILFIGAVSLNVASSTLELSGTKRPNEQSGKPLTQDPFTVVIGQDKTFTSYNFHRPRVGQFGNLGDLGQPTVFDAVSSGNRAYTHILAQGDQEGYGISDVGVLFPVVQNPDGTGLMDAWVSITFSYTLGVELNIPPPPPAGSGHAKIGVGGLTPFVEIDYISFLNGTHSSRRSGRVTETQAISLGAGNTYQIWANAYSDSHVSLANYADSYAEVTVEETKVTFVPNISGRVTDCANNPISGVTVSDGIGHSATTQSNGNYRISGLAAGTYTITPTKTGYTFLPVSRTVTVPPHAENQDFTAKIEPVLLVHGLCGDEGMWGPDAWPFGGPFNFEQELRNQGFAVETIDLVPKPTNGNIWDYVDQLSGKITSMKEQYHAEQVDIVAHSLGGLAARAYAWRNSQRRDVRTLIMLGTPNNGSGLLRHGKYRRFAEKLFRCQLVLVLRFYGKVKP